jgi:hypothetical protein
LYLHSTHRAQFQSLEDAKIPGSLHFNLDERYIRVAMSVLTIVLWVQLVDYYRLQIREERRPYYVHDSVFWKKYRPWCFAAEVAVLGIHVFPGVGDRFSRHLALFMVFRMYLFFRVLRNRSRMYRLRFGILADQTLRTLGTVHVSWALAFKVTFLDFPWMTVTIMVGSAILVFSFGIYCYERQPTVLGLSVADMSNWTIRDALWLVVNTSSTLGLGDLTPRTSGGRVVVAVSVLSGLILASLLVYVILSSLSMKTNETHARNVMWLSIYSHRQRSCAATAIQLTWRQYAFRSRMGLSREEVAASIDAYRFRMDELKARLKRYRRELAIIRMQTGRLYRGSGGGGSGGGSGADVSGDERADPVTSYFNGATRQTENYGDFLATNRGPARPSRAAGDGGHGGHGGHGDHGGRGRGGGRGGTGIAAAPRAHGGSRLGTSFADAIGPDDDWTAGRPDGDWAPAGGSDSLDRVMRVLARLEDRIDGLEHAVHESHRRSAAQNREIMIALTGRDPAADSEYDGGDSQNSSYDQSGANHHQHHHHRHARDSRAPQSRRAPPALRPRIADSKDPAPSIDSSSSSSSESTASSSASSTSSSTSTASVLPVVSPRGSPQLTDKAIAGFLRRHAQSVGGKDPKHLRKSKLRKGQ